MTNPKDDNGGSLRRLVRRHGLTDKALEHSPNRKLYEKSFGGWTGKESDWQHVVVMAMETARCLRGARISAYLALVRLRSHLRALPRRTIHRLAARSCRIAAAFQRKPSSVDCSCGVMPSNDKAEPQRKQDKGTP